MSRFDLSRRKFLRSTAGLAATLPLTNVRLAFGGERPDINFAYISDAHIQQIHGSKFVRNWDRGLIRAVAETNLLKPEFVVFGGDLAQLGSRAELDHGAEILSKLDAPMKCVLGEHDYYLDLGAYWSELFGEHWYSWDYKDVHFVVLNSILTDPAWIDRWPTAQQRMIEMAGLDNPNGSPFMVGQTQRDWLADDLEGVSDDTPVVVFSHSPIQKIFKNWNFWTDDAEQVQALLKRFQTATVIYGHVHQIQYNRIGNINFHAVMATAWPWPYPETYAQAESHLPVVTVPMNRADPFHERDATGWQLIDVHTGRATLSYRLFNNTDRVIRPNSDTGMPEDAQLQDVASRVASQRHY